MIEKPRQLVGEQGTVVPATNSSACDKRPAQNVAVACRDQHSVAIDDLPQVPAITEAELKVIEMYFSDVLDMVLGEPSLPAAFSSHKDLR